MKHISFLLLMLFFTLSIQSKPDTKPSLAKESIDLTNWQFAKTRPEMWTKVVIPHSCNYLDGQSAQYYRGKSYYKKTLNFSKEDLMRPLYLLFEGAAQAATVSINGKQVIEHRGGYTPFVFKINDFVKENDNEVMVMCNNKEDIELIPVSSDFNKNNGLHYPAHLLKMDEIYASPVEYGLYRMHVSTPQVSKEQATTNVETCIVNSSNKDKKVNVLLKLIDADGKVCISKKNSIVLKANEKHNYKQNFTIKKPHLWDGLNDPYLYQAKIEISYDNKMMDYTQTTVGYRFYKMDPDKGFYLNGHPYSLRGVSMHHDYYMSASALNYSQIDTSFELIKEIGTNFMRLAHYPHNDYTFRKCDELGIIIQTEIPWVNICGIRATEKYFNNINSQMTEMITNLYNHPCIVFWGMWNEVDGWGNRDEFQGKLDPKRAVAETERVYNTAKSLDPYRFVGLSDCSNFDREGYNKLKADYYSENKYNGWYYSKIENFSKDMIDNHKKMGIVNVSEYGVGINPNCHSSNPLVTTKRSTRGNRHDEEFGNIFHEDYLSQIVKMPFLNFTSLWVMFDFPVASRQEGYMETEDGINFVENDSKKFLNDKGLVTRDRKVKKDVFYLYKAAWNKNAKTVYITSKRFKKRNINEPVEIKVYSNAASLTLYQNGKKVETLNNSGEVTGVIWKFKPIKFTTSNDKFKVVSSDGVSDEVTLEGIKVL